MVYLTQSTTPIIGQFAWLIGKLIEIIYDGLCAIGIPNLGVAIILLTLVIKLLMLPLTIKQQKFTKLNTVMQPEINKIQKKYRGKKDQESMMKMNQETQAVYEKYGASPTGSCLPLLIQFPILFALYRVIYNIPAYVDSIKSVYMNIVTPVMNVPGYIDKLSQIANDNSIIVPKVTERVDGVYRLIDHPTTDQLVDFLYKFSSDTWNAMRGLFADFPQVIQALNTNVQEIVHMNQFIPGINLAEKPGFKLSIALIIPICAGFFQWLSAKTMDQPEMDPDAPGAGMTKGMLTFMPLMSAYMAVILPAALGIYWAASAFFQVVQQLFLNWYMKKHVDVDELIEKSRKKAAKKKAKRKGKPSFYEKMMAAQGQETPSSSSTGTIGKMAEMNTRKVSSPNSAAYSGTAGKDKKSISAIANIMREYDQKQKK